MDEQYTSKAKNPSKKEWEKTLLEKIRGALDEGKTPEQALELLTLRQYDFLVDRGIDLDNLILTPTQQANVKDLLSKGVGRPLFPNGYDKKYPKHKIELYTAVCEFLAAKGAEIIAREKENYRDIDFVLNEIQYKVVLSMPRTKKSI